MTFRIAAPIAAQMRYMTNADKQLLMAQRNFEYARQTGDFNPTDMIMLGLLDAAIAAGSEDAREIKNAIESSTPHCGCKAEIGKNYQTKYLVWTERKGGLETAYQCHLCGSWLVSDAPPDELSAKINEARAGALTSPIPDSHRSLKD